MMPMLIDNVRYVLYHFPCSLFIINTDNDIMFWSEKLEVISGIRSSDIPSNYMSVFDNNVQKSDSLANLVLTNQIDRIHSLFTNISIDSTTNNFVGQTHYDKFVHDKNIFLMVSLIYDDSKTVIGAIQIIYTVANMHYLCSSLLTPSSEIIDNLISDSFNAILKMMEYKDQYTADHQRRVAELLNSVSDKMGLSPDMKVNLHIAGLLHDVGKSAIPLSILHKPSALSTAEFNLVKEHSQISYSIISHLEIPDCVKLFVLQHHEKLDGSGYPYGLTSSQILFGSSLLNICDMVESLSSHRSYRPAFTHEVVKKILDDECELGKIDKRLVDIVIGVYYD